MGQTEVKRQQIELYTHMLGCVAVLIAGNILQNEGIAYMAISYGWMRIFWVLFGSRAGEILTRMLRSRAGKGQYRNMKQIEKNVFLSQMVLAVLGSVIFGGMAGIAAEKLFCMSYLVSILWTLVPVLFLQIITSTLVGRFQGEGNELPGVLTGILRQILLVLLVFVFATVFTNYGEKVSELLRQPLFRAMYGGVGAAVALGVAEIIVLGVLLILLWKAKGRRGVELADGMKTTDSFSDTMRIFYGMMGMAVLISCLEKLGIWAGTLCLVRGTESMEVLLANLGVLYGKFFVICTFLILPVCAATTAFAGRIATAIQKEDKRLVRRYFQNGIHIGWIHGLFFSVYQTVMAEQIAGIFSGAQRQMLVGMLRVGSGVVVLSVLNYYFLKLLCMEGKRLMIVGGLTLANAVCIGIVILTITGEVGDCSLIYGLLAGNVIACIGLGGFCMRTLRCGMDWGRVLAIPLGAALICGLVALIFKKLLAPHLGDGVVALVVMMISAILYWTVLFLSRNVREQELKVTSVGRLLYKIGHLVHLV